MDTTRSAYNITHPRPIHKSLSVASFPLLTWPSPNRPHLTICASTIDAATTQPNARARTPACSPAKSTAVRHPTPHHPQSQTRRHHFPTNVPPNSPSPEHTTNSTRKYPNSPATVPALSATIFFRDTHPLAGPCRTPEYVVTACGHAFHTTCLYSYLTEPSEMNFTKCGKCEAVRAWVMVVQWNALEVGVAMDRIRHVKVRDAVAK